MRKSIYILGFIICFLSICNLADGASKLSSCAVIFFEPTGDATSGEAGMLANMISVNVARSDNYAIIPRYKVNSVLSRRKFNSSSYSSSAAAALAAGRMLNVDLVIFGAVSRTGAKNEASARLLDVKGATIVDRVQLAASGNATSFRRMAASEIARKLSGKPEAAPGGRKLAKITPPKPEPTQTQPTAPKRPSEKLLPPPTRIPARTEPVTLPSPKRPIVKAPAESQPSRQTFSAYLNEKADAASVYTQNQWSKFRAAAAGNLEVGMRYRKTSLGKETADSFLGTINTLDVENDGIPAELFATWYFNEYIGAEISWFNLRARTVTNPAGFSDGAICVSGPTFAITGKYEDYAPWIPFASAGIGLFSATFDHQPWWKYGYGSVEDWLAAGSPSSTRNGKIRNMDLSDAKGLFFLLGVRYVADENWSMELAYRTMSLDVDDHYTITTGPHVDDRGTTTFPLDNSSVLIGVRYSF